MQDVTYEILLDRFPQIAFALSYTSFPSSKEKASPLHSDAIEEEIRRWEKNRDFQGVEVIYLYGLGSGAHYLALQGWLKEKQERSLVFIEDDLSAIEVFRQSALAHPLLSDRQVHISYLLPEGSCKDHMQGLATEFLSDRIEVLAIESYKKNKRRTYTQIKKHLLAHSSLMQALFSDVIYYHLLCRNIVTNSKQIPDTYSVSTMQGKFAGIPAVICGAGPSLDAAVPHLKQMETQALLLAGGSTITALGQKGITPHIALALDPNEEEYERLKANVCLEIPFLFSPRLCPEVFDALNMQLGYLHTGTGGPVEKWIENGLGLQDPDVSQGLSEEAFSVTTIALAFATFLGCDPIIFCGVDLAYTKMHRYADGVMTSSKVSVEDLQKKMQSMDKLVACKNRQRKKIYSQVKWVMEANCLGQYAKKQASKTFFNCSEEGLSIPHTTCMPLEEIRKRHMQRSYDLKGMFYAGSLETRRPIKEGQLREILSLLKGSLSQALSLVKEMLSEIELLQGMDDLTEKLIPSGTMSVIQMDLEEEVAYDILLSSAEQVLERKLSSSYRSFFPEGSHLYKQMLLKKKHHIFMQMKVAAEYCLSLL